MLDDLRNSSAFIEDEEPAPEAQTSARRPRRARSQSRSTFLGMTAMQRFFLSLMLFMMIFILGIMALVLTGSIYLPF